MRRVARQGKDLTRLEFVVRLLVVDDPLPSALRDHELSGNFKGVRDLHIAPDWLLLYEKPAGELVLIRTGSHAELF